MNAQNSNWYNNQICLLSHKWMFHGHCSKPIKFTLCTYQQCFKYEPADPIYKYITIDQMKRNKTKPKEWRYMQQIQSAVLPPTLTFRHVCNCHRSDRDKCSAGKVQNVHANEFSTITFHLVSIYLNTHTHRHTDRAERDDERIRNGLRLICHACGWVNTEFMGFGILQCEHLLCTRYTNRTSSYGAYFCHECNRVALCQLSFRLCVCVEWVCSCLVNYCILMLNRPSIHHSNFNYIIQMGLHQFDERNGEWRRIKKHTHNKSQAFRCNHLQIEIFAHLNWLDCGSFISSIQSKQPYRQLLSSFTSKSNQCPNIFIPRTFQCLFACTTLFSLSVCVCVSVAFNIGTE